VCPPSFSLQSLPFRGLCANTGGRGAESRGGDAARNEVCPPSFSSQSLPFRGLCANTGGRVQSPEAETLRGTKKKLSDVISLLRKHEIKNAFTFWLGCR
jgi:hypothetical protein